jgi:three-Cys-motif partner protein
MRLPITYLRSADHSAWKEDLGADGLPLRPSGAWIDTKHRLLTYYADVFSRSMKRKWENRVYLELFSGPGKCLMRNSRSEADGSPLKVIDREFSKFIFTEMNVAAAEALAQRLAPKPNSDKVEIWCGDCRDAINQIKIPAGSLTFAFIDPTGIGHAPFSLIKSLREKTRCDILINVQHAMGIKMNVHQYTPDSNDQSALTKFLGNDEWKKLSRQNPRDFFRGVLDLYKKQLESIGFAFIGREVLISNEQGSGLYLLLFASAHERGKDFWEKSMKGVLEPELFD